MKGKRFFFKQSIFFISVLSIFLIPAVSFGTTFCVNDSAELQTALSVAESNGEDDTIQVVQGTYYGNFIYAASEPNSLALEGGYTLVCVSRTIDPENTVLDGGGVDHVLALARQTGAADFSLDGLTLQNGNASTTEYGGGLYARTDGNTILTNNIFSENRARSKGGGAYVAGTATLTGNSFNGNKATVGDGGGLFVESSAALNDNTFIGNISSETLGLDGMGGGAYVGDTATLINNIFTGNIANRYFGMNAGGAYISGNATLTGNIFRNNNGGQGSVYIWSAVVVTLSNNTFTGNPSFGAGVNIMLKQESGSAATLTNNIFSDNGGHGFSIMSGNSCSCDLTNNTFSNNASRGASIEVNATLIRNTFSGNSGGGLYIGSGDLNATLISNTFRENSTKGGSGFNSNGGGASIYDIEETVLINNIFTGNTATDAIGGGVYINSNNNITLTNNTVSKNLAVNNGGGIYLILRDSNYNASIYNNIIWNNTAPEGSDIYIDNTGNDPFFPVPVNLFNNDFDQSASGARMATSKYPTCGHFKIPHL